jgi:hypothetical protein
LVTFARQSRITGTVMDLSNLGLFDRGKPAGSTAARVTTPSPEENGMETLSITRPVAASTALPAPKDTTAATEPTAEQMRSDLGVLGRIKATYADVASEMRAACVPSRIAA